MRPPVSLPGIVRLQSGSSNAVPACHHPGGALQQCHLAFENTHGYVPTNRLPLERRCEERIPRSFYSDTARQDIHTALKTSMQTTTTNQKRITFGL